MRFGIAVPNWGPTGDPRVSAEIASLAEDAGWDAFFTWDAFPRRACPPPSYDPWLVLGAVAVATHRIRIGTCIAVVPRYQPYLLARALATLDRISNGRMILGVGIGDGGGSFESLGEDGSARTRAARLDEALHLITRLWDGELLHHRGAHYVVDGLRLNPTPVQTPRIPIWVGGDSDAAMRRAARWDGWIGPDDDPLPKTVTDLHAVRRRLENNGASLDDGFEIAWAGMGDTAEAVTSAGATWSIAALVGTRDDVLARVKSGPAR